jgi:hypothetical protein
MRGAAIVAAAALVALAVTRPAAAQCPPRPTDAAGYAGYVYAPAEMKSHATATVRVHYAASGAHAPDPATTRTDGVPDTVAYVADTAEDALTRFASMGYARPPSDVSCASNGGDDKLDVYLVDFAGADGSTVKASCNGSSCGSFVLVDATFKGRGYPTIEEGFRTVVVHELFHAVQNAYVADMPERFWAEGTAQWAMKVLHPELVDFERQLPAFFAEPKRSLDSAASGVTAGYLYGSSVWPLFLSLRHGPETIREIFEAQGEGPSGLGAIAATDAVLKGKGASLADEFPLFCAWNVGTKDRAGTGGYPDAAKYPGIKGVGALDDGRSGITSGLASFSFVGDLGERTKVALETDETRNGGVLVPLEGERVLLEKAQKLPAVAEGRVLVVVAGITAKKTDAPFTLRLLPPDDDATSSSSSGASSVDDGSGCSCGLVGARHGGGALDLVALGALGLTWRRRRRRPHALQE